MAFIVPMLVSTGLNLLLARSQTVKSEGPRLALDSTLHSRYGAVLPRTFGSVRLNGSVIVASEVEEIKSTKTSRPSKKGPKVEEDTYSYYQTAAIAVAMGPQDKLLRIWANNKVIFDQTTRNTSEAVTMSKFGFPQATAVTRSGEAVRFYSGAEDQLPDPKIEEIVDRLTGVEGSCPAFRGTAYVVLDEFEVTDYGGKLPNFEFEITRGSIELPAFESFDHTSEGVSDTVFLDTQQLVSGANSVFHKTGDELYQVKQQDQSIKFFGNLLSLDYASPTYTPEQFTLLAVDGTYLLGQLPDNSLSLVQVTTGKEVARQAFSGATVASAAPFDVTVSGQTTQKYWIITDADAVYYTLHRTPSSWGAAFIADTFDPNYKSAKIAVGPMIDNHRHILSVCEDDDRSVLRVKGEIIDLAGRFVDTYQWREREDHTPVPKELVWCESDKCLLHFFVDQGVNYVERITPPDLTERTSHSTLEAPTVSAETQYCIDTYFSGVNPFQTITDNPGAQGWMWQVSAAVGIPYGAVHSYVSDGEFKWIDGNILYSIRLHDGQYAMTDLSRIDSGLAKASGATQFFDSRIGAVVTTTTGYGYTTIFGNRLDRQGEELATIVAEICYDCGLTEAQLDVTDLAGITVQGVNYNSTTKAKDLLLMLAEAYNFVGREIDDKIVFTRKNSDPVRTILHEDLLPVVEDERKGIQHFVTTRKGDSSLPSRLELTYFDLDRDYQEGHQSDKRSRDVFTTHDSQKVESVAWPLVLYTAEAAQQAERMLYTAWVERDHTKWALGPKHIDLVPGDVIKIRLADGKEFIERLTSFDIGTNFSVEAESVRLFSNTFVSTKAGVTGSGVPTQALPGVYDSELFLMDMPLLTRVDEPAGQTYIPLYVAVGADDARWSYAQVQRSVDGGETYTNWMFQNVAIPHGLLAQDFPRAPHGLFAVDDASELVVNFSTDPGEFSSITDLEFLEGTSNLIKVGEELIQFRDAVKTGDTQWTFSHLRRGAKGTDAHYGPHLKGTVAVVIDASAIEILPIDYSDLNVERHYITLSKGQYPSQVSNETNTFRGNAIRPWAPSPFTAEASSGDIVFSWQRRARTAATDWLQSSTGDALANGESVEQYELNIYDDGILVRTEVISSASSWTYTAADQTSDGYSNDGTFTATVAQYSSRLEEYGYTTSLVVVV